ncbi:MAG TPA: hypothetical protein VNV36_24315 [Pseudomonas sp.]|uniref:hypothetical protein n=1 Tax=Pseudomonas sp. TaxID=306 RepID=UPI002BA77BC1|nr:hypothetical protein [Pseudomonas sp.]HWH89889.1 hypothetical protein [Pseudomonas sp.]
MRLLTVPEISCGCVLSFSVNGTPTKASVEHFKIYDLVQAFANFNQGNQTIGIVGVLTTRPATAHRSSSSRFQPDTIPADSATVSEKKISNCFETLQRQGIHCCLSQVMRYQVVMEKNVQFQVAQTSMRLR